MTIMERTSYISGKVLLRTNTGCCPLVVRLMSACCPLLKRTTSGHQSGQQTVLVPAWRVEGRARALGRYL